MLRIGVLSCEDCGSVNCVSFCAGSRQLLCRRCRLLQSVPGPSGPLLRLFRVRRRWAADGKTPIYERYEP